MSDGSTLSAAALYQMLVSDTYMAESNAYDITGFSYDPGIGATALTATPVPLPASVLSLLSGLAALTVIGRRRNRAAVPHRERRST